MVQDHRGLLILLLTVSIGFSICCRVEPAVTANASCDGYYGDGFEDSKTFQTASSQTQVQRSELDVYSNGNACFCH